jgi:hypothetical protein
LNETLLGKAFKGKRDKIIMLPKREINGAPMAVAGTGIREKSIF